MNKTIKIFLILIPLLLSFIYLPLIFALFLTSLLLLKLSISLPIKKPQLPLILILLVLAPALYYLLTAFLALTSTGEIILFDALIILLSTISLPFITLYSKNKPEIAITILLPIAWIIIQSAIHYPLLSSHFVPNTFDSTTTVHTSAPQPTQQIQLHDIPMMGFDPNANNPE